MLSFEVSTMVLLSRSAARWMFLTRSSPLRWFVVNADTVTDRAALAELLRSMGLHVQAQDAAFEPARRLALTLAAIGFLVAALLGIGIYVASRRIALGRVDVQPGMVTVVTGRIWRGRQGTSSSSCCTSTRRRFSRP